MVDELFFQSLKEKYYAPVSFPLSSVAIQDAVKAFYKFLEEPDSVKTFMNFRMPPVQRRGEVGFYHRDPTDEVRRDSKDFFHFHPVVFEKYQGFIESHPTVADFMHKALPIWEKSRDAAYEVFSKFEPQFPGTIDKVFKGPYVRIFLRFLHYNWVSCGKYLAQPHFDAGSFTLAISESDAGLRIGSCPEDLKLVSHQDGQALFFLSSVFNKVIETRDYVPAWHDVIQLDETVMGKPFARWAVVAFIEVPGVEQLLRSETHKFAAQS
jgi:hypothetical protein